MAEELQYIGDTLSKLSNYVSRRHPPADAKPQIDSRARASLHKLQQNISRPDGKQRVITTALDEILCLAEQGRWDAVREKSKTRSFETATKELEDLKEAFKHNYQAQVYCTQTKLQSSNPKSTVQTVHRMSVGPQIPVEPDLPSTEQANQLVNKIKLFLKRLLTTPDALKKGENEDILHDRDALIEMLTSDQISPPSTESLSIVCNYTMKDKRTWDQLSRLDKEAKIEAALREMDAFLKVLDTQPEPSAADEGQVREISLSDDLDLASRQTSYSQKQKISGTKSRPNVSDTKLYAEEEGDQAEKQNSPSQSPEHNKRVRSYQNNGISSGNTFDDETRRSRNSTLKKQASQEELEEKDREISNLRNRVSKLAGDNLRKGNPHIADLSDNNRPTKLAEKFSELYDNEWCDAYEELMKISDKKNEVYELRVIEELLKVVKKSRRFCARTIESQMDQLRHSLGQQMVQQDAGSVDKPAYMPTTEEIAETIKDAECHLKQAQRVTASLSIPVLKLRFRQQMEREFTMSSVSELEHLWRYVDKCIEIIWYMSLQDPPMFLGECIPGDKSPANFREYTERGSTVVALAWPSVHIYAKGPVMTKGVAIMK